MTYLSPYGANSPTQSPSSTVPNNKGPQLFGISLTKTMVIVIGSAALLVLAGTQFKPFVVLVLVAVLAYWALAYTQPTTGG